MTGRRETERKETGRRETGRKETRRKEMGGKTNGSKERGVGETVAKESGGGGEETIDNSLPPSDKAAGQNVMEGIHRKSYSEAVIEGVRKRARVFVGD